MRIYTRTGDGGETGLFGGGRLPKSAPRIAAYGEVDELNAVLGWCAVETQPGLRERLRREQALLFHAGAWLATPPDAPGSARAHLPEWPADVTARLEREIDAWEEDLPALQSFVLPGGVESAARLHLARTVCRRAERACTALARSEEVDARLLAHLNRLSDWLFVAARAANAGAGEADVPWNPRADD